MLSLSVRLYCNKSILHFTGCGVAQIVFWYLTETLYCVFGVPLTPFYGVCEVKAYVFWYLTEPLYCVF